MEPSFPVMCQPTGLTTLRCAVETDCDDMKAAKNKDGRKRRADLDCSPDCYETALSKICLCKGNKCNFGSRPTPLLFDSFAAVLLPTMISQLVARI